jgi:hypothetical protein
MMPKPKPVNWKLIESDNELYDFVQDLITKYHGGDKGIDGVSFVLMWRFNVKQDPDGFIWLADITKSADKYRELRPHDIIIGINKDAWSTLDPAQKAVLIDCQLERVAVSLDKKGEIKEDDQSRTIYRLRNPHVVEDETIRRRHGIILSEVHEHVFEKFNACGAEEGSYIAEQLAEED